MNQSDWMQDAALSGVDPKKLEFLQKLVFEINQKSDKEKLPFMLALAKRAQKEQIQFSKEETMLIADVLKKYGTDEELKKMNFILNQFYKK